MAGFTYSHLACLKVTGGLVATFNPGVYGGVNATVWTIAVYPSGIPSADKVVIGGEFNSVGGYSRVNVARLDTIGSTDTGFDTGTGNTLYAPVYAVATDYGPFTTDGSNVERVLIGRPFTGFGGQRNDVARLISNGNPDFNVINSFVDGIVKSLRVQTDHKILLGGSFAHAQSYTRNGIVRLIPNQDLIGWDFDWAECSTNGASGGAVETLGLGSTGAIYVGGQFITTFEGSSRLKIARLIGAP